MQGQLDVQLQTLAVQRQHWTKRILCSHDRNRKEERERNYSRAARCAAPDLSCTEATLDEGVILSRE